MSAIGVEEARRVLKIEAQCLLDAAERLNGNFSKAVEMLVACKGKVIVTGVGKSGLIGRKIASTLSSTGTPAMFIHATESAHGELGVIAEGDMVIAISVSGEAEELGAILKFVARRNIPLIAMTGKASSTLGKAGLFIDISVKEEACPLGVAPMSSSTTTLAVGDALAGAVLKQKGFTREDFAEFHPGGALGKRLLLRVKDMAHMEDGLPIVKKTDDMVKVISLMTSSKVFRGLAGVVDEKGDLCGIITDGDIRRRLEKNKNPLTEIAEQLMSRTPKTIDMNEFAEKALFVMEQFQIQSLFVIDKTSGAPLKPVGLIHIQDLLKAKFR